MAVQLVLTLALAASASALKFKGSGAATPNQTSALFGTFGALKREQKLQMWLELTREMDKEGDFKAGDSHAVVKLGAHVTVVRKEVNDFTQDLAEHPESKLFLAGGKAARCGEVGDGHFLKEFFGQVCNAVLVVDKFSPKADVKLDMNLLPSTASSEVRQAQGTMDLLVSHQVLEHVAKPSVGMANLNAMLRTGGTLVFSVPFIVFDHAPYGDQFRYTVRKVHDMLACAGFTLKTLQGRGSSYMDLFAALTRIDSSLLTDEERAPQFCDGLEPATNLCSEKMYNMIVAVAVKNKNLSEEDLKACYL